VAFLGGSERVAGDIVALALTISVLLRLSVSHLIDDIGTRRMWAGCAVLFVTGGTLFLLCDRLNWLIYAARIAFVVGLTGMFACSVTHIQNQVPAHRRTEVIGNLGSSGFIGMILGSNVGDWIYRTLPQGRPQFLALFGGAALIGLAYLAIALCITRGQRHERAVPSPPAYRLLFRHWPGMVIMVAMIMGLGTATLAASASSSPATPSPRSPFAFWRRTGAVRSAGTGCSYAGCSDMPLAICCWRSRRRVGTSCCRRSSADSGTRCCFLRWFRWVRERFQETRGERVRRSFWRSPISARWCSRRCWDA
jgi:MFS family permease